MIEVRRYSSDYINEWNNFLSKAKNSSFLFDRNFMDYHSDRFIDYSLMIFDNNQLVAIIPANINEAELISHQGLSYGGIILLDNLKFVQVIFIVKEVLIYLKNNQIKTFLLKFIPRMYHTRPCDELDWLMFKLIAKTYRRDTALVIDIRSFQIPYQERRKRSIKKGAQLNILIKEGVEELEPYWKNVLIPNLYAKHSVAPVHSLAEIKLLASRFPDNIKQHNIYLDNVIVAGCTMFINKQVAHAQYISGTDIGKDSGCLDLLFDHLIKNEYSQYNYFDFGICNENGGHFINKGLLDWKEGFGARTIAHDFYEVDVNNVILLDNF
jgi:hypothetical protein